MFNGERCNAALHPGNVVLVDGERIAFIDFGATSVLNTSEQTALGSLLLDLRLREPTTLRDSMIEVADVDGGVDAARLDRALHVSSPNTSDPMRTSTQGQSSRTRRSLSAFELCSTAMSVFPHVPNAARLPR